MPILPTTRARHARRALSVLAAAIGLTFAAGLAPQGAEASATVTTDSGWSWPGGQIPYDVYDSHFPDDHQIYEAIAHWNELTPVTLIPLDQVENPTSWLTFKSGAECHGTLGTEGDTGEHQIRLHDSCAMDLGSVVHEIGHVTGLFHEQSRSDRDNYVEYLHENVLTSKADNFMTWAYFGRPGVDRNRYDYDSIMHYPGWAFSKDSPEFNQDIEDGNYLPTLEVVSGVVGVEIGQRGGLSPGDIAGVSALYSPMEDAARYRDDFGEALVACDFNQDGVDDLAVGIPGKDAFGRDDAGMVHVIYGLGEFEGRAGVGLTHGGGRLAPRNEALHLGDFDLDPRAGDEWGHALAAADFNGDGICDLAVGAPGRDVNGISDAGEVTVLFGGLTGFSGRPSAKQIVNQTRMSAWMVLADPRDEYSKSAEPGDRFGSVLAAGDFNNDGVGDLAVGVPLEDVGSSVDAGMVNVIAGTKRSPFWWWDLPYGGLLPIAQFIHQDVQGIAGGVERLDRYGSSLVAADFNGDGHDDLAVGVPGEDLGRVVNAGGVNVHFGGAYGYYSVCLASYGCTESADRWFDQNHPSIAETAEHKDSFGYSLAAGDFDADGAFDLAIGAHGEDFDGLYNVGVVHVIEGVKGDSPGEGGLTLTDNQVWRHDDPSGVGGQYYGKALTARRKVNDSGDVAWDLIVGAPGWTLGQDPHTGAVQVLVGTNWSGLSEGQAPEMFHRGRADVLGTAGAQDYFGSVLAAGDFDGDGNDDIAIGVRMIGSNLTGAEPTGATGAGEVHVLYEEIHFAPGISAEGDQIWHQDM